MADFKVSALKNPEFNILADFKILDLTQCKILAFQDGEFKNLVFHNREYKTLADFKISAFQNPEFKILGDLKTLAL